MPDSSPEQSSARARLPTGVRLAAMTAAPAWISPIWKIALYRFLEVSWGIAVAVCIQSAVSRIALTKL